MDRARADDPVISRLTTVLGFWHDALGSTAKTVGAVKEQAELKNPFSNPVDGEFYQALADIADDMRGGISVKRLGRFLEQDYRRLQTGCSGRRYAKQRLVGCCAPESAGSSGSCG
jgi:hypothetical protein